MGLQLRCGSIRQIGLDGIGGSIIYRVENKKHLSSLFFRTIPRYINHVGQYFIII